MSSPEHTVEVVRRALTDLDALPGLLANDLVWHFAADVEGIASDANHVDHALRAA